MRKIRYDQFSKRIQGNVYKHFVWCTPVYLLCEWCLSMSNVTIETVAIIHILSPEDKQSSRVRAGHKSNKECY